ncbi:hypothetical protein [Streptomyces sp. NRRL B-1347]|uniref:hypothetical protein n=1 Tax=Streptomyces sp. NRRL B-1347 TaxID=1476877 RepID=UPI0004CBEAB4|nr:hypothetical protein [Streptomyces sp. NRRL B-1347]
MTGPFVTALIEAGRVDLAEPALLRLLAESLDFGDVARASFSAMVEGERDRRCVGLSAGRAGK